MRRISRRTKPKERGSALVIALTMIVVVGLMASAALTYASTSLNASSTAIAPDRVKTFAADGALDVAVKYLAQNTDVGRDGGASCGNVNAFSSVASLPASGNAPAVDVQCKPQANSGKVIGSGGDVNDATPAYAVLALGTGNGEPGPFNTLLWDDWSDPGYAERGVHIRRSLIGGDDDVNIEGSIYSNSPVRRSSSIVGGAGNLVVNGTVTARGGCENVSPCTTVPYTTPPVADPMYPSRAPDLTPRTVPACPSGTLVKFLPGWYSDAAAMNNLFRTCADKDFWFSPGTYYFDFRGAGNGQQCRWISSSAADAAHEWCIGSSNDLDAVVLGGTPAGEWDETPSPVDVTLGTATTASGSPGPMWSNTNNARTIDGANATLNWSGNANREIAISGFPSPVPTTAQGVTSVAVDVVSQITAGAGTRFVRVTAGDGTLCGTYAVNSNNATLSGGTLATCLSTPTKVNGARGDVILDPSVNSGTLRVDGIRFRASYTPAPERFAFPDGCDPSAPGVQFIFGGDSRMYVSDGSVELCAGPNPAGTGTNQQIALYGVRPVPPIAPSTAVATSGQTWATVTDPNNAKVIGEQGGIANAMLAFTPKCALAPTPPLPGQIACTAAGNGSGTAYASARLTFPGYTLPANTIVQRVDLRASYWTQGNAAPEFVVSQNPNGTGWTCTADSGLPTTSNNVSVAYARSLTSCLTSSRLASGFTIEWRARTPAICAANVCNANQQALQALDGLEVMVAIDPATSGTAVVMPQDGCLDPFPDDYGAGNDYGVNYWNGISDPDCALLKWEALPDGDGCFSGQVALHGTLYAPGAVVDMEQAGEPTPGCSLFNPSYQAWDYSVFDRGVIVRHLRIKGMRDPVPHTFGGCGSVTCGGTEQDRVVDLEARISGTTKVVARVRYPVAGGPPKIERWTVS